MVNSPWRRKCVQYAQTEQIYRHHFEISQWQKQTEPNITYLCYRWFQFLTFFIVCCCSIFSPSRYRKTNNSFWIWLAFLTNWGYLICVIQSLIALIIVQRAWIRRKRNQKIDDPSKVPFLYRFYWNFHISATDVAFTVTTVYWTLVHNPEIHQLDAINFLVHAMNSVLMLIDLLIVRHPCRLLQLVFPITIGLIYTIFSYIYYVCGGTNREGKPYIYKALDWRKPQKAALFAFLSIIVVTVLHITTWSIVRCRLRFRKSKVPEHEEEVPNSIFVMQEKPMLTDIV